MTLKLHSANRRKKNEGGLGTKLHCGVYETPGCVYVYIDSIDIRYATDVFLQDVSRHTPVSPINSSEQYYLVDVVAFILKYLKDQLYEALSKDNLSRVQFDWVVTVPAIWDIRGKQMMREAAYKV